MNKTVRVVCALPTDTGIIFRAAEGVTSAFDGDGHGIPPQDLELKAGITTGVALSAVEYWKRRTAGLRWEHVGDTVVLSVDESECCLLPRQERARIERERIAVELEYLERDRRRSRR